MVAGFLEHFLRSRAKCIPDIFVERAQLYPVIIDQLGEIFAVVGRSFFMLCRMLFVTSRSDDGFLR